jgi:peptidoglycan/LPS O-acetylase OafA/YrhL
LTPAFVLQPAWSLAVELAFYAVAPFLVRHRSRIVVVMLAAFVLRWSAFQFGFGVDPYTYRFFPIEIGTFMLGALAYHLYRAVNWPSGRAALGATAALWALVFVFGYLPPTKFLTIAFEDRQLLLYGALTLLLPLTFRFTSSHGWDRIAGEVSFPLYLCHWSILLVANSYIGQGRYFGLMVLGLSLVCAGLTYWLVDRRIDDYRHRTSPVRTGAIPDAARSDGRLADAPGA